MVTAVTLDSGKVEYTDLPLVLPRQFRLYRAAASMCRTNGSGRVKSKRSSTMLPKLTSPENRNSWLITAGKSKKHKIFRPDRG